MEINVCNQVFGKLFNNKIIIRHGTFFFCEFLECTFENEILSVKTKVLEPVVKLKPRYQNLSEKLISREYFELKYHFNRNKYIGLERQKVKGLYSSSIWANYDFIKKIYDLKEQGLEQEIYDTFW